MKSLSALRFLAIGSALLAVHATYADDRPTMISLELPDMPEAVTSFGAVVHDNHLYIYGGHKGERHSYSAEMVSGSFHRIKLSNGVQWERLPSSEPTQGASLVAHGVYIYRIGGMAARNREGEKSDLHSKDSVERFNTRTGRWEAHVPMPEPRSSHDAAVAGNNLYVAGGWRLSGASSDATWHDTLVSLDLSNSSASWRTIPQPFKRRALAMAVCAGNLYFLGGMDSEGNTSLDVDILNLAEETWTKGPRLPNGPMKGFGASATSQDGQLYFSGMKGELCRLAKDGQSWESVGVLRQPRFFHRLVPAGNELLIAAGGEDSSGKIGTLEILDLR